MTILFNLTLLNYYYYRRQMSGPSSSHCHPMEEEEKGWEGDILASYMEMVCPML